MIEPRKALDLLSRRGLKFLGGTPKFDLWVCYAGDGSNADLRLRIQDVDKNITEGDTFYLPLWDKNEIGKSLAPEYRRARGLGGNITLTREQVDEIDTYLRCFAPWVLGTNLTEERNNET